MQVVTRYLKGGGVRKIAKVGDRDRFKVPARRASRVEPADLLRRAIFLILRAACGDSGRVAAWTRTWQGPWRARMLLRPRTILGPFPTRDWALSAEADWITKNWVLAKDANSD